MHFNGVYDSPLVHLGPYLVGIFYGFFKYNTNFKSKQIKMNLYLLLIGAARVALRFTIELLKNVLILGWTSSIVLVCLLMFTSNQMVQMNRWIKHSFATLGHTFWGLILLWTCVASNMSGLKGAFISIGCEMILFYCGTSFNALSPYVDDNGEIIRFICFLFSKEAFIIRPENL